MSNKHKLDLSLNNVIYCAVYAIIGILLVILKGGSLGILMTVVGVLFAAMGVYDLIQSKNLVKGIIEIAIGVVIIVCGWLIADIVLLIFGILLVVKSVMDILKGYTNGFMAILPSIITLVIGILLIIAKWTLLDVLCIVVGVIFIVNAILILFGQSLTDIKKKDE